MSPRRPCQQRQRDQPVHRLQAAERAEQQGAGAACAPRGTAAVAQGQPCQCRQPGHRDQFGLHARRKMHGQGQAGHQRHRPPAPRRVAADHGREPVHGTGGGQQPQRIQCAACFATGQYLRHALQHVAIPRGERPHLQARVHRIAGGGLQLCRQTEVIGDVVGLHRRQPCGGAGQAEHEHRAGRSGWRRSHAGIELFPSGPQGLQDRPVPPCKYRYTEGHVNGAMMDWQRQHPAQGAGDDCKAKRERDRAGHQQAAHADCAGREHHDCEHRHRP